MYLLIASAENHMLRRERRRGVIRKIPVFKFPCYFARFKIGAQKLVLVMADVELPFFKRARASDIRASFDFLDFGSVLQIDDVQERVASAENGFALRDRWRA